MVRKSKRKQAVVPFERSRDAVDLEATLTHCASLLTLDESEASVFELSSVLRSLQHCSSILQQTKVLQENKTFFKRLIGEKSDGSGSCERAVSLLLYVYLEPTYFPLRKSLEWIGEAICRSSALDHKVLRSLVRSMSLDVLARSIDSGELVSGGLEECLHWVFTFSSMVLLDKEISWLDDSVLDCSTGVWTSDVWPATNHLGEGSLLKLLQAMCLVLQRCTAGLVGQDTSTDASATSCTSASDALRYSECVGECMRVLSSVLKSRRKASIPPTGLLHSTFASSAAEEDEWGKLSSRIISYGCQLLSCENCNKDILTQAALTVISVQWLLRERLWISVSGKSEVPHPYSGYQLVSIVSLLNLNKYITTATASAEEGLGAEFAAAVGVHHILSESLLLPKGGVTMLARVALLRACISVFDRTALMWPDDFERKLERHLIAGKYDCLMVEQTETIDEDVVVLPGLLMGPIIDQIIGFMQSTDPLVQVYGLQTLETWLGRIEMEGIGKNNKSDLTGLKVSEECNMRSLLLIKMYDISNLLCRSWSHPHKLISHVVPAVFQRLIDLFAAIESKMTSKDAINTPDYDDIWCKVLTQTLKLPPEHRGRYQALSALLPKIGARRFLHVQPDIIRSLVLSMRIRDVSSSVSQFMGSFLTAIKAEKNIDMQKMRAMYTKDVVEVLCSSEKKLRLNGNDYLLQELMKLDPDGCGPSLINEIRNLGPHVHSEHRLWGLVSVALQARLLSKHGGEIDFGVDILTSPFSAREKSKSRRSGSEKEEKTKEEIPSLPPMKYSALKANEVRQACLSDDVNLRLASLTLLVASQRTVAPLHPLEMNILQDTLPYSLKSHVSDHRQRVLRVLRLLVTRLFETHRSKVKEITKSIEHRRKTALETSGISLMPLHIQAGDILSHVTEDEMENAQVVKDIHKRVEWLNGIIVTNLYPGSPNEKQIMALEMLKCIIDGLSNDTNNHSNKSQLVSSKGLKGSKHPQKVNSAVAKSGASTVTCDDSLIHFFFTESITTCLLNLLLSSWDRTRTLASEVILKLLPTPWPGFDDGVIRRKPTSSVVSDSVSSASYQSGGVMSRMASLEDDDDSDGAPSHKIMAVTTKSNEKVLTLFRMGCDLVGSPRHRNADNGALLLRVVMSVYSLHLRWSLRCPVDDKVDEASDLVSSLVFVAPPSATLSGIEKSKPLAGKEEGRVFIDTLSRILAQRLVILHDAFRSLFDQHAGTSATATSTASCPGTGSKPISIFSHGVVLALRYCIDDINSAGVFTELFNNETKSLEKEAQMNSWKVTIQNVFQLCLRALQIAMMVVAEAPADTYFAPMPNAEKEKEYMLVVDSDKKMKNLAENTNSTASKDMRGYASDSFMMNTNIFMDIDDESNANALGGDGNASNGQHIQHAVVGAWLLVKESCALLAKLVQISLNTAKDKSSSTILLDLSSRDNVMLATDDIATIGGVILDALSRLKHNGAIAEAQVALQSVCESVLRHTTADSVTGNALNQLPNSWIETLFAKLRGEQKASILRRSAGFAFSFLSLLRSEPKNCRPVLLPLAMEKLFFHAVNGCGLEGSAVTSNEDKWRAIVHALNIIRLIILDATLGPDLYPYIAEATKIAVRGFKSDRWAVRNSSMMVFSAVVQRSVDNDKKENGGARAATPEEFFGRFPSLYPFFVVELSDIVQRPLLIDTVSDWPVAVGESKCRTTSVKNQVDGSMAVHPSLYPILLMLSKMKTTSDSSKESVVVQGSVDSDEMACMFGKSPSDINISLFVPLVEECCDQQLYHVRVMAAKALASLIPLTAVPSKVTMVMKEFRDMFCTMFDNHTLTKAPTRQYALSSNLLHGMLLQVLELLSNAHKLVCGKSSELGDNKIVASTLFNGLRHQLVPELCNVVDALRVVILKHGGKNDFLETEFPPAILLTLTRIFRMAYNILNTDATKQALEELCKICFSDLLEGSEFSSKLVSLGKRSQFALDKSRIPMNPLLWKECITDLVQFSGEKVISELIKVLSQDNGSAIDSENLPGTTREALSTFYVLKQFLEFPVSEVREGVIIGCVKILNTVTDLFQTHESLTKSMENKNFLFNNIFVCYHQNSDARQISHSEDEVGLLNQLLRRFLQETEPPILEANLELLEQMSTVLPFVNLGDVSTQEAFTDSIPQLLQVVCGTYRPDTLLDFMDPTTRTAFTSGDMVDDENEYFSIAPTMSAAYAINILGWVMGGFFNSALVLLDTLQDKLNAAIKKSTNPTDDISVSSSATQSTDAVDKVLYNFFFKFTTLENNLSRTLGNIDVEESVQTTAQSDGRSVQSDHCFVKVPTASSEHAWSWLRLIEMAVGEQPDSDGEIASLDARLSAAQTLHSSGALQWAVLQSAVTLKQANKPPVTTAGGASVLDISLTGGGGDFSTRLWLVALRLLQDDDVDVRFYANSAVSKANSLGGYLMKDVISYPTLFPSPEQTMSSNKHLISQSKEISQLQSKPRSPQHVQLEDISSVEGRSIERLASSLAASLAWKLLSDTKKSTVVSLTTCSVMSRWTEYCGVPDNAHVQVVEKIFEVDENNAYEEGVLTSSTLASSLAGAAVLLLPLVQGSISSHIWKGLVSKATSVLDKLRTMMVACPTGNDYLKKHIGSFSFDEDEFSRLYCGLEGVAQLVTRLRLVSRSMLVGSETTELLSVLGTLRRDTTALLGSMQRSEISVHPLLVGLMHEIATEDSIFTTSVDSGKSVDGSQRGGRVTTSYGSKKGLQL